MTSAITLCPSAICGNGVKAIDETVVEFTVIGGQGASIGQNSEPYRMSVGVTGLDGMEDFTGIVRAQLPG